MSITLNPIINREIRSRLRKRRTFLGMLGYVALLSLLVWGIYAIFYETSVSQGFNSLRTPSIQYGAAVGKAIFIGMTFLLLIVFPFTAVALASDAIAGERERQTFDMLRITALNDRQIVWGKLGAVFIFVLLYVMLTLPIQALAFLFGGVALTEFLIATFGILVTGLACGAFGIYVSSIARSARVATALSSSLILLFVYGLPFMVWISAIFLPFFFEDFFNDIPTPVTALLLFYGGGFLTSINPLGAAILTGIAAANGQGYFLYSFPIPTSGGTFTLWAIAPWMVYVVFYLLVTLGLVFLTTRRLRKLSNFEA